MWWKSLASFARARYRSNDALSQAQEVPSAGRSLALAAAGPPIHLVVIGAEPPDPGLLEGLAAHLEHIFGLPCLIDENRLDPTFAFNTGRNQYYATQMLQHLFTLRQWPGRVLGVTPVDLFVPVLTFVFGEAQLEGHCAVVSHFRLAEPDRPELLLERLKKEAVHELGHTFGLRHCHRWECVMSSSHSVERLDVKSASFCAECKQAMNLSSKP